MCCIPYYLLCCCLCWKEKEFAARVEARRAQQAEQDAKIRGMILSAAPAGAAMTPQGSTRAPHRV